MWHSTQLPAAETGLHPAIGTVVAHAFLGAVPHCHPHSHSWHVETPSHRTSHHWSSSGYGGLPPITSQIRSSQGNNVHVTWGETWSKPYTISQNELYSSAKPQIKPYAVCILPLFIRKKLIWSQDCLSQRKYQLSLMRFTFCHDCTLLIYMIIIVKLRSTYHIAGVYIHYIVSFYPYNHSKNQVFSPFYRWRYWGLEITNWPNAPHLYEGTGIKPMW